MILSPGDSGRWGTDDKVLGRVEERQREASEIGVTIREL